MSKKIKIPESTKGYGYCGTWMDGKLGWFCAPHICGEFDRKYPSHVSNEYTVGKRMFLCEIVIKPLKDKKGRPITKIVQ